MKKKILGIFVCMLLIATAFSVIGLAEDDKIKAVTTLAEKESRSLIVTLESELYTITTSFDDKTEINMIKYGSILVPGNPKLPSKIFNIGVPPGGEVVSIELISENHEVIPGSYNIVPAPPFSNGVDTMKYDVNEEIYSSLDPYPTTVFDYLGMGQLRKYSFARVRFSPISYFPISGKLKIYKEITLKIDYKIVKELSSELLADRTMDDIASEIIINFQSIYQSYIPSSPSHPLDTYDYVIITTSSLVNSINFLKNWKELIGYSVKVVNKSWISSNYAGLDLEEKIRNFLIDKYAEWGIEYVLIVGSHSTIPMRYCYSNKNNHNEDGKTPTDYYYADLTGNWDSDGDSYYGERYDDSPNFNAEVWIGRIPVDTPNIVENICQKTINFEQDDGTWKDEILLCGPIANFANEDYSGWPETDDATLMEELWSDIYNPSGYSRTTMYEKAGLSPSSYPCDYPLTHANVLTYLPDGYGIVNLGGHGSPTSVARKWWDHDDGDGVPESNEMSWESYLSSSDNTNLNDGKPSIVFSCGCNNAYPEDSDNLGKSLLVNGSVGYVGSTRLSYYTVGWEDESYGGNAAIEYYFFKYLVNQGQTCAEALYNSKLYYLNNFDWWEWQIYQNLYDFCLYGDPALSLTVYTEFSPPNAPNKPSGPTSGKPGVDYSYTTSTIDPDGHQIYYKWSWGDGSFSSWLGPFDSGENVEANHEWETGGEYEIKVKAKDFIGSKSDWSGALVITIENAPPNMPMVSGETNGKVGVSYVYSASSIDPDGDRVSYWFEWGDGANYGWIGPYDSGTTVNGSHVWSEEGTYIVKVKAKDIHGEESTWATLEVTMPKNHQINSYSLLQKILELFPNTLLIPLNYNSFKVQNSNIDVLINSTLVDMYNEYGDVVRGSKAEYIDQEQTLEVGSGLNINYGQYVAQSFKPSVPRLSKVYLKLFKYNGVPTYDLEFSVREQLSGSNLVYVTKGGSEVINGWNEFDFSDLQVEIDKTYYLVCEGDGGQGNDPIYCWYCIDTNPYNRGMTYVYNYGSWHSVSDVDCCFKTAYTNDPPNQPSNPDPYDGETGVDFDADLSWTCSDPDGDPLTYDVYFEADDSSPDVLVSDDQTGTSFDPGFLDSDKIYYWQIIAEDNFGVTTPGPVWFFTTIENEAPNTPMVSGETNGKVGVSYVYSASSEDFDGDQVYYLFDWGDGTNSSWVGPYDSGATGRESHVWSEEGTYIIKVKAKDIHGEESTWAMLEVTMPKNQQVSNMWFLRWLERFPLLQRLLGVLGRV